MNNRTGLFIVMAIVAGVGMLYVNLSHAPKKPPASAARIQSPQQNECVTTAALDYNKIKLERIEQLQQNLSPTAILSVEKTIEERRLQEQYCQRFARCLFDPGGNEVAALSYASAFAKPVSTLPRRCLGLAGLEDCLWSGRLFFSSLHDNDRCQEDEKAH